MKALLLDTETTGLIDNRSIPIDQQPEVIEFYACLADLKKGKVLKELHSLVKPSRPLAGAMASGGRKTKTISEITGIDDSMLISAPPFEKIAKDVFYFIESSPLVIAQNASFDKEVLDIEAERLKKEIKWPPVICAIEQTIHLKGYRMKLSDMHEYLLGKSFTGAHRAKADTLALMRCCTELVKRGLL